MDPISDFARSMCLEHIVRGKWNNIQIAKKYQVPIFYVEEIRAEFEKQIEARAIEMSAKISRELLPTRGRLRGDSQANLSGLRREISGLRAEIKMKEREIAYLKKENRKSLSREWREADKKATEAWEQQFTS